MVVALLAAPSTVPACNPPGDPVVAKVALYDGSHYNDVEKVIFSSDPDLSRSSWSGRISSLQIEGGISVAVYSQPDYTGTCDTFVGEDPDLANDRIGDDQIASIRMFYNCSGPVVDPAVVGMTAVTGSSDQIQCPFDYVKRDTNLNEGAGGDFIYLCLHYESKADAGDSSLTGLEEHAGPGCGGTVPGPTPVPVDLNQGTDGDPVYLCYYTKGNNNPAVPNGEVRTLRDVEFLVADSDPGTGDPGPACISMFVDASAGTIPSGAVGALPENLNSGAGGKAIYACTLNDDDGIRVSTPNLTPPTISFAGSTPAPDAAGWNNTPVTLTWNCTDSSGHNLPRATRTLSADGANQSATAICEDTVGNIASDTQTGISIDSAPPVITFANRTGPDKSGWSNTDVTVAWNCSDALSGAVQPIEFESVTTDGANQSVTGSCADLAGNTASDTQTGINVDKTAPALMGSVSPAANASGWFNTDVTVQWKCGDGGGSGLAADCPPNSTITGEGVGLSTSQSIGDRAGNQTKTSVRANIDRTAPQLSVPSLTPPANSSGWNNGDVTATWLCSDGLSGVPAPSTSQVVTGEGDGLSATGTCADRADNQASDTVTGIRIDRTAPVLTASAVTANGAPYAPGTWTNQDVTVTFTCADQLSGVATVTAPQTLRAAGGDQHVDGGCDDNAGNHTEASFGGIDIDKTAPVMSCSANPATLAPPAHQLVPVKVTVQTTDDLSGPAALTLLKVTSSEPDKGLDAADVPGDIQGFVVGTPGVDGLLRAERSDTGVGRVYTLTYRGADAAGNTATCQATVTVPLNQKG
jgi:hypothetical protein